VGSPWKLQNGRLIKGKREKKSAGGFDDAFGGFDDWLDDFSDLDDDDEAEPVVVPELTFAQRKALVIAKCKADRLRRLLRGDLCFQKLQRVSNCYCFPFLATISVLGTMGSFCYTLEDDEVLFPFQEVPLSSLRESIEERDTARAADVFVTKLSQFNPPVSIKMTASVFVFYFEEAVATGVLLFVQ
jgi:hypothetical protein